MNIQKFESAVQLLKESEVPHIVVWNPNDEQCKGRAYGTIADLGRCAGGAVAVVVNYLREKGFSNDRIAVYLAQEIDDCLSALEEVAENDSI